MKRRAFLVLAATIFAPAAAWADETATPPAPAASAATDVGQLDAVYLRDGALFRGRVTEIAPKDHVTIAVEGGETKHIPWAEVDRVIVSSVPMPPPAPAASAPAPPAKEERAFVHVTTPKPVILYRRPPGSTAWQQVCASPCDKELPVSGTYRVVGSGVAARELGLQANGGEHVDLKVDPSSTMGMLAGGVLMAGGVVTPVAASEIQRAERARCAEPYSSCDGSGGEGIDALGLIGGAALIGGVVLFLFSVRTSVTPVATRPETTRSTSAAAGSAANGDVAKGYVGAKAKGVAFDAFVRRPTWRSLSSTERATPAAAATFPLLFQHAF